MSQFQRVVDLTASEHDEGEASGSERQALPASHVVPKRKPGRPPLPPELGKSQQPKSVRPIGRPRKHPKPTEENLVTGPEISPEMTQPRRNHGRSKELFLSDLDDDSNEYRTSDRLSKQALHDIERDRRSIDLDKNLSLGDIRREKRLISSVNTSLDVEGFDIQNTSRQIRQGHSRQLMDDGFSAWAPDDVPATQVRTRHDQPMRYETCEASNDVPHIETKARRNRLQKYCISDSSDDVLSPEGRAHHDHSTGHSTQNWPYEERGESRTSLTTQEQKKRKLIGPKKAVDGDDVESRPTYSCQKSIRAEDLHGLKNPYKAKRRLGSRGKPQVRDHSLQAGPSNRFPTSVDPDDLHPSQQHEYRYSLGSDNAQQEEFSQHPDVGELPHSVGNELIGINRKGLSDKSPKSTRFIQNSDDEGEQMQVDLFLDRRLVKTVTKEVFEEHLDWLEYHEVSVNFNEFWSKEDEFELLWDWSQGDEDMHNAFVSQEMPLSIDMRRIWGLTPPRCLPDGLEFSIRDNDFLEDGRRNTNLSASTCDLLHTCLLLPAFRDALPFFHFMIKKAVYLRLRNSPYKVERPREVDLMMKAGQEHLTKMSETVKSYTARFVNSAEADTEKAVKDLINELSLLEVNRSGAKLLNGYDHLAMRNELRKPSSSNIHDTGVTPNDLSAIIDAWKVYAEKNKLRQAHWYRADHELRREASDIPPRKHWARVKKALTLSIFRAAKISSRKEMAEEKARIFHPSHMRDKTYEVGRNMSREGHKSCTVTESREQTTTPGVTGLRKPSPVLRSVSVQNPGSSGQVQSSLGQHLGAGNAFKAPIQRREARKATPKVRSVGDIGQEASKVSTQQMEEKDLRSGRGSPHQEPLSGHDTRTAPINADDSTAEVRELIQPFLESSQDRHTPLVGPSKPTALMVKQAKSMATAVGKTGKIVPAPAEAEGQEETPIEKAFKEANKLNTTGSTDAAMYTQYGSLTDESYESDGSYDEEELVYTRLVFVDRWDPELETIEAIDISVEYNSFLSDSRAPKVPDNLRFGGQYIRDNFGQ